MDTTQKHWWLRLRDKLFILDRARLTSVLVAEQALDLFTTWWLIFYAKTGREANPLLDVINGENGLAWLVGIKIVAATFGGLMCWLSLGPKLVKRRFWVMWNALAYFYAGVIAWNSYLMWSSGAI